MVALSRDNDIHGRSRHTYRNSMRSQLFSESLSQIGTPPGDQAARSGGGSRRGLPRQKSLRFSSYKEGWLLHPDRNPSSTITNFDYPMYTVFTPLLLLQDKAYVAVASHGLTCLKR